MRNKRKIEKYWFDKSSSDQTTYIAITLFNRIFETKIINTYGFDTEDGYHEFMKHLDYSLALEYTKYRKLLEKEMSKKNMYYLNYIKMNNKPFFKIIQPRRSRKKTDFKGIEII